MTDDELLLNTAVSFPIAFSRAVVKGLETRLDVPRWGRMSGSISYSLSKGTGFFPLSGGLFLGDEAGELLESHEEFALSQDQRHTVRARGRVEAGPRVWLATAAKFDSGLPVETEGEINEALLVRQYGRDIVDRVDFDAGRVKPSFSVDLSAGVRLTSPRRGALTLQVDVANLTNRLNVINFSGLFSGTALAAPRSVAIRLHAEF